jgi:hypothetical protein
MGAPEIFEVHAGTRGRVVERMQSLAAAQAGWITLQPGVHPGDVPPPQTLFSRVFSASGPPVPVCTWVAPAAKQKPPHPEVGILHASGTKAERRLATAGTAIPDRWVVLSDHPRRGLVIAVHPDHPHDDVLAWLLAAGTVLTRIPVTGSWRVEVHR